MSKRISYPFAILLCFQVCIAQPHHFSFRTLTTKNGLSYNLVNCLFQDREGYIWVGTFNGLNRYDGSRFVVFKSDRNNPAAIAHNNINDLCEDSSGNIWIGTANGVSHYLKSRNVFTNYLLEPQSRDASRANDVTNIVCDRSGRIWVTSLGGLYEFDPEKRSFISYKNNPSDSTSISSNRIHRNAMKEDPVNHYLWLGSDKGLNCFDLQKKIFYNYKNNPEKLPVFNDCEIFPISFDRKNRLVYGDYGRLKIVSYSFAEKAISYTDEGVKKNDKQTEASLAAIFFDINNNTWVCSWNNLVYFRDAISGIWERIKHDPANPSGINSDFFWDVIQAKDGSIYIGGMYGLSIYDPTVSFYSIYKPADNIRSVQDPGNITGLTEDESGKLWFSGLGLYNYDFNAGHYEHYPLARGDQQVTHLTKIKTELWLSTPRGITIFNPELRKFRSFDGIPESEKIAETGISWCYGDSKGDIWFSAGARYLYRFDPVANSYRRYNPDSVFIEQAKITAVKAFTEDRQGNLWFGTYSGMLYKYTREKDLFYSYVPPANQKPLVFQRPINDMHADTEGKIWLATEGGGLIRFDPATEHFKAWRESDGLVMDVCNRIIPDGQGKIWVGSYEGFTIFDPHLEKIEHSKIDYGQRENNFYSKGKYLLKNGKLVLGNDNTFIVVDPLLANQQKAGIVPVISNISIFEKPKPLYKSIDTIRLSYKENFFTIDFSSLSSLPDNSIEYSYRLKGYDKDWVNSGNRNFATYTGVDGGLYAFEVKAKYKGGEWSPPAVLSIDIKPPFWETWWFRATTIAIFVAGIVLIMKIREQRLVKEEKIRGEFRERITASEMKALRSQMNPHFLYNSLNAIRLFVLQNDSDNAEKYLVKFARLMRLILDNSRQEWVSLASELDQLYLYIELEQLRFNNGFDFSIETDSSLRKEDIAIPPMIIQPYIENAILHGIAHKKGKGNIIISLKPVNNHLECTVEDNGVGRERAAALKSKRISSHNSVGLQVTEERLQLVSEKTGKEASVSVIDKFDESRSPAGTKVIVRLPLVNRNGEW
ncbi:MAG: histidine kinase [Chitinophagaceae bacterium]|nr:histidine kinase [Chitinophagaceae bacterium]